MGGDIDGDDNSVCGLSSPSPDAMRFASVGDIDLHRWPGYKKAKDWFAFGVETIRTLGGSVFKHTDPFS